MRKYLVALVIVGLAAMPITAQEWGEMQCIDWFNPPPLVYPGFFNPSYCDAESLLYFDSYFRQVPYDGSKIYSTVLENHIDNDWIWSDVETFPSPINITGYSSLTPDINAAGDSIYFSSDRPGTRGGLDLWLSIRTDGVWGEPINLGDSINTEADELGSYYAKHAGLLFFERFLNNSPEYDPHKILMAKLEGEIWQSAKLLPTTINADGYYNYGPYFDEVEKSLYYTNVNSNEINLLKKSALLDNEWGEPVALCNNVNGFWYPNYCDLVTTENVCMSHDRNLLFYSKWIWEATYCIDYASILFVSERTTGVDDEFSNKPKDYAIMHIYPNPSNGLFHISLDNINEPASMKIYNVKGQLITSMEIPQDIHSINWNSTNFNNSPVASGVYFAVLRVGEIQEMQKLVLLK